MRVQKLAQSIVWFGICGMTIRFRKQERAEAAAADGAVVAVAAAKLRLQDRRLKEANRLLVERPANSAVNWRPSWERKVVAEGVAAVAEVVVEVVSPIADR